MYVEISVAVLVKSNKFSENVGNYGKILLLNLYNGHISFWGSVKVSFSLRRPAEPPCAPRAQGGFSFPTGS